MALWRADRLSRYESRIGSQNGEAGVLLELVRRIEGVNRFCVEFGIGTGAEGNCVHLAELGWGCLFLEKDRSQFAELERRWAGRDQVRTVPARVTPENINRILLGERVPAIGVLSIDVDGNDFWIWRAIESRPAIVVIEYNAALPVDVPLVQPFSQRGWDLTEFFGASLAALERLGTHKGYRLIHTESMGVNAFFVRGDLAGGLPSARRVRRVSQPGYPRLPADPQRRAYLNLDDPSCEAVISSAAASSEEPDTS